MDSTSGKYNRDSSTCICAKFDNAKDEDSPLPTSSCSGRRSFLANIVQQTSATAVTISLAAALTTTTTPSSRAQAQQNAAAVSSEETLFKRETKDYAYEFQPPQGFVVSNKPLKTHLDELLFTSTDKQGSKGYQYGITVDPVRISSLREFGKPEEVAARVVLAELNRDGVTDVTLYSDPVEDPISGAYAIDYISDGKRGKKHFVTRILVKDGKLYVLTAQVKEEEYKEREKEILDCVSTFRVTS